MLRRGFAYTPDTNAALPFEYALGVYAPGYSETWSERLTIYQNPNALYPLDENFFPECMNLQLEHGQIVHNIPEFHSFSAETITLSRSTSRKT